MADSDMTLEDAAKLLGYDLNKLPKMKESEQYKTKTSNSKSIIVSQGESAVVSGKDIFGDSDSEEDKDERSNKSDKNEESDKSEESDESEESEESEKDKDERSNESEESEESEKDKHKKDNDSEDSESENDGTRTPTTPPGEDPDPVIYLPNYTKEYACDSDLCPQHKAVFWQPPGKDELANLLKKVNTTKSEFDRNTCLFLGCDKWTKKFNKDHFSYRHGVTACFKTFILEVLKSKEYPRCMHEMIVENRTFKMYFDLEEKNLKEKLTDEAYENKRKMFFEVLSNVLTDRYGVRPTKENLKHIWLDGSRQQSDGMYKFSAHVIMQKIVCNNCQHNKDVAKAVHEELRFVDPVPYGKNRLVRIPGCWKASDPTKTPLKFKDIREPRLSDYLNAMITYVPEISAEMIQDWKMKEKERMDEDSDESEESRICAGKRSAEETEENNERGRPKPKKKIVLLQEDQFSPDELLTLRDYCDKKFEKIKEIEKDKNNTFLIGNILNAVNQKLHAMAAKISKIIEWKNNEKDQENIKKLIVWKNKNDAEVLYNEIRSKYEHAMSQFQSSNVDRSMPDKLIEKISGISNGGVTVISRGSRGRFHIDPTVVNQILERRTKEVKADVFYDKLLSHRYAKNTDTERKSFTEKVVERNQKSLDFLLNLTKKALLPNSMRFGKEDNFLSEQPLALFDPPAKAWELFRILEKVCLLYLVKTEDKLSFSSFGLHFKNDDMFSPVFEGPIQTSSTYFTNFFPAPLNCIMQKEVSKIFMKREKNNFRFPSNITLMIMALYAIGGNIGEQNSTCIFIDDEILKELSQILFLWGVCTSTCLEPKNTWPNEFFAKTQQHHALENDIRLVQKKINARVRAIQILSKSVLGENDFNLEQKPYRYITQKGLKVQMSNTNLVITKIDLFFDSFKGALDKYQKNKITTYFGKDRSAVKLNKSTEKTTTKKSQDARSEKNTVVMDDEEQAGELEEENSTFHISFGDEFQMTIQQIKDYIEQKRFPLQGETEEAEETEETERNDDNDVNRFIDTDYLKEFYPLSYPQSACISRAPESECPSRAERLSAVNALTAMNMGDERPSPEQIQAAMSVITSLSANPSE